MTDRLDVKQEDNDDVVYVGYKLASTPEYPRVIDRSSVTKEPEKKKEKLKNDEESKKFLLVKVKNPLGKRAKVGSGLDDDTLNRRLEKMNWPSHDVTVPQGVRDIVVPWALLSSVYGGNARSTFPKVAKKFLDRHGLNDFMCVKLTYNPEVPQIPGVPGFWFVPGRPAHEWDRGVRRLFTCIADGYWMYMGQYSFTPTESLTLKEVARQGERFFTTWGNGVIRQLWGRKIALRVAARKRFNCRNPTEAQIQKIDPNKLKSIITLEDVTAALKKGEEEFGVWEMRCVGYDARFQESIAEQVKTWVPPPPKPKKDRKEPTRKDSVVPEPKTGKKRKRSPDSDPEPELSDSRDVDSDVFSDIDSGLD